MLARVPVRIELRKGSSQLIIHPFVNPLIIKIPNFAQTRSQIFRMVTQSRFTKRITCPSCSKPTRTCLCNRLRTPTLHNSVAVTILQHSLEKKHPLNSTRIATIGLKNVDVNTVSDVNFQARFFIRLLDSSHGPGLVKLNDTGHLFGEMTGEGENAELIENSHSEARDAENGEAIIARQSTDACFDSKELSLRGSEATPISFIVEKYGASSSFNGCGEMSLDRLWGSGMADDYIRKGFVVKKLGRKLLEGGNEYEESEEFEIRVPRGSVLLFPSERSVDFKDVKFEIKNLIVLDGTWAKAKRMYNENPWLKLLPHARLDLDKLSLYSEVRHQPRAGYLSTIESIVYAMKALGEESVDGLDALLDVFESMVGDQRQCKDERLRKASKID